MKIHNNFLGGNIEVVSVNDNEVILKNEIHDTEEDWFYWSFCVNGAEGRTVKFTFDQPNRIGYYGAAVSSDLLHWRWSELANGESFTYTFRNDEKKCILHIINFIILKDLSV